MNQPNHLLRAALWLILALLLSLVALVAEAQRPGRLPKAPKNDPAAKSNPSQPIGGTLLNRYAWTDCDR